MAGPLSNTAHQYYELLWIKVYAYWVRLTLPFYLQVSRKHATRALHIKSISSRPQHASSQTHPSTTFSTTATVITSYTRLLVTIALLSPSLWNSNVKRLFFLQWRRLPSCGRKSFYGQLEDYGSERPGLVVPRKALVLFLSFVACSSVTQIMRKRAA